MEYRFMIPKEYTIDREYTPNLRGGSCPRLGLIYVYGYGETGHHEIREWTRILAHEHLHNLFYKLGIPLDYHHKIIYKMGPYF